MLYFTDNKSLTFSLIVTSNFGCHFLRFKVQQGSSTNRALLIKEIFYLLYNEIVSVLKKLIKRNEIGAATHLHRKYIVLTFTLLYKFSVTKFFITNHSKITIVHSRCKCSLILSCSSLSFFQLSKLYSRHFLVS